MRLYGIVEDDVEATIESPDVSEPQEHTTAFLRAFPGRYGDLPLKVVVRPSTPGLVVVTAYPLKKKAWRST